MKFIIPTTLMAICVGVYFLYISPAYSEMISLKNQKSVFSDTLQKSKDLANTRESILASYEKVPQEEKDKLAVMLPEKNDGVLLAFNLSNISSAHGMIFSNFKASSKGASGNPDVIVTDSNKKTYTTTTATFQLTGYYDQFLSLLKDLEMNMEIMDVTSISVKRVQGDDLSQNPLLEFSIGLDTYSLNK